MTDVDDRPGEAAAHARRAARPARRCSASTSSSASTTPSTPTGRSPTPFTFTDGSTGTRTVGNRFAVLPMEGWDGDRRRTTHRPRAPPVAPVRRERRQARVGRRGGRGRGTTGAPTPTSSSSTRTTVDDLAALRAELVDAHVAAHGSDDGLVVGLQLTHSGRWSRPDRRAAAARSRTTIRSSTGASRPTRPSCSPTTTSTSSSSAYVDAAVARRATPASTSSTSSTATATCCTSCSARSTGPARYGGVVRAPHRVPAHASSTGIRTRAPEPRSRRAPVGVRLRARTRPTPTASACPRPTRPRSPRYAFGGDGIGHRRRPHRGAPLPRPVPRARHRARVHHRGQPVLQPARPAAGVLPAVRRLHPARGSAGRRGADDRGHRRADRARIPTSPSSAPGYSYLQQWLPHAAQHAVRTGGVDVGRASAAACSATRTCRPTSSRAGRSRPSRLCRTFSDCTTAPRNGLVSGCYPLDDFYKDRPERIELADDQEGDAEAHRADDIAPGLCSITFRSLTADDVLARRVPRRRRGHRVGRRRPRAARRRSDDRRARGPRAATPGVEVVSYGSYLGMAPRRRRRRRGRRRRARLPPTALGAPMVRIWTEFGVTPASPPADRRRVTERTAALVDRIADARPARGARVPSRTPSPRPRRRPPRSSTRSVDPSSARTGNPIPRSRLLPRSTSSPA